MDFNKSSVVWNHWIHFNPSAWYMVKIIYILLFWCLGATGMDTVEIGWFTAALTASLGDCSRDGSFIHEASPCLASQFSNTRTR